MTRDNGRISYHNPDISEKAQQAAVDFGQYEWKRHLFRTGQYTLQVIVPGQEVLRMQDLLADAGCTGPMTVESAFDETQQEGMCRVTLSPKGAEQLRARGIDVARALPMPVNYVGR